QHRAVPELETLSVEGERRHAAGLRVARAALLGGLPRVGFIHGLGRPQRHAVLRAARSGETRLHLAQVQLELVAVARRTGALVAPQALRLGVDGDQLEAL